jgi:ubiquitin-protein ligase
MSVRLRRLQAEYERLQVLFEEHPRIRIVAALGRPPDKYIVEYQVKGLVEENGKIQGRALHRAEITLGPSYPREMPRCVMLTPIFHPNIDYLAICTEDIGSAGQTLDQTILFIGEMISFQAYNLQSPRNGDAARWTQENQERLPLEKIDLTPALLLQGGTQLDAALAAIAHSSRPTYITSRPCANCGRTDGTHYETCLHGHLTCEDCRADCANCEWSVCLLCTRYRCAACQRVFCEDCLLTCQECEKLVCLTDGKACVQCQHWLCAEHVDINGLCALCLPIKTGSTGTGV